MDHRRDGTTVNGPTAASRHGHRQTSSAIVLVRETFELDRAAARRLMVQTRPRRDAGWDKADTVVAICQLLRDRLDPEAVPRVAVRPAALLGGRTLLEAITENHHALVYDVLNEILDPW